MSGRWLTGAAMLLALALAARPVLAAEVSAVPLHNPFKRPAQALVDPATLAGGAAPLAEAAPPRLVLKALLLAGPDTVASINDQLLRWKGIEATEKLASSANAKIVVIGSGKDGLPLILNAQ